VESRCSLAECVVPIRNQTAPNVTGRVLFFQSFASSSVQSVTFFADLTVVRMRPRFLCGAAPTYQPFPLPPELDDVPTPVRLHQIFSL